MCGTLCQLRWLMTHEQSSDCHFFILGVLPITECARWVSAFIPRLVKSWWVRMRAEACDYNKMSMYVLT